jgi:coenzyme PQQ precursor peptide PqqA
MEWEKPELTEISLACEISSYANAELEDYPPEQRRALWFESGQR